MHQKIKQLRVQRGMTMQELAQAAGTSQQQIDRLEKGRRKLTIEWVERLSRALECDAVDLLPPNFYRGEVNATCKSRVIGAIQDDHLVHSLPPEKTYPLLVGRSPAIKNKRLFALRVDTDSIATLPQGTELIFVEVDTQSAIKPGSWVISADHKSASGRDIFSLTQYDPLKKQRVRAALAKTIRDA